MKLKNKIAALSLILVLQNFGVSNAAAVAEKNKVEVFYPDYSDEEKSKTKTSKNPAPAENPTEESPQKLNMPNPVTNYASFKEIVQAVGFTPLYIPKKDGYEITAILSIDTRLAEIRYSRKWEPNVALHVRTYRRTAGEDLKDISGVNNVKWRVNIVNGVKTYIAKIDDNKNVATWAVGNYTFSAYVENLAFAAFNSLVADELVDLSNHYYLAD